MITKNNAIIKTEVNLVKRGCYVPPTSRGLCQRAQEEFEAFCEMPVVEKGLLFGGKICAALDRQHPRDLFDIKWMLENEGIDESIKKGFIFYLISGGRPSDEILHPNLKDQKEALKNQFLGMTE